MVVFTLAFQQMLFSVILTISQGTKQSVSSIQFHERLQVTFSNGGHADDQITVYFYRYFHSGGVEPFDETVVLFCFKIPV